MFRIIQHAGCPSSEISRQEAPGADSILLKQQEIVVTVVCLRKSMKGRVYAQEWKGEAGPSTGLLLGEFGSLNMCEGGEGMLLML